MIRYFYEDQYNAYLGTVDSDEINDISRNKVLSNFTIIPISNIIYDKNKFYTFFEDSSWTFKKPIYKGITNLKDFLGYLTLKRQELIDLELPLVYDETIPTEIGELEFSKPIILMPIESRKQFDALITYLLDEFVQTRDYDNVISCISYIESPTEQCRNEALYINQLRDEVQNIAYTIYNDHAKTGEQLPTLEELKNSLPEFKWPN